MITNNVDEAILLSDRIVPLSRGPRATLAASVEVPLSQPRCAAELMHDEAVVRIRSRIVETLTGVLGEANRTPKVREPYAVVPDVVTEGES
jgi:nitrate/nitrite transport system ATP-binding protein